MRKNGFNIPENTTLYFNIYGTTEELKSFTPTMFFISGKDCVIWYDNEEIGRQPHHIIKTREQLEQHFRLMENMGFTIDSYAFTD